MRKNIIKFFKVIYSQIKAKKFFLLAFLAIILLGLGAAQPVFAALSLGGAVATVVGWITYVIDYVLGYILTLVISVMVNVAQFNNIINVKAVNIGWAIIRDLCNMFFILILLVIAFATILRIESYSAKRLLPKLLIMAVLINFSKTIFGLIIDFSQVIMLTFVNGFSTNAPGNFVNMFHVQDYLKMPTSADSNISDWAATNNKTSEWNVALGLIAGAFALLITLIVMIVLLVVLIFRIIMLWVYTILSPLVFFGAAFPGGQKYTSRIWEDFIKQVLVGPLLAFFIWLALLTAEQSATDLKFSVDAKNVKNDSGAVCAGNNLFCTDSFQTYIITIALLIGGLMVTQSMGGVAGSAAGKGLQWAKRASLAVGGAAAGAAAFIPKQYAKRAGYGAADLALEGLKGAPLVGRLAMKGQAKLRMKREYAEDKDTRYMQYLSDPDLDMIIGKHRGKEGTGAFARVSRVGAFVGRGMESDRQDYKRALDEKMKKGYNADWGPAATRARNKTRAMIDFAIVAGHSVTDNGEDSFRDAEAGRRWQEFKQKNVADIDDNLMGEYYGRLTGRANGEGSQYYNAATGNFEMQRHAVGRLSESEFRQLSHTQMTDPVLDLFYNGGGGPLRAMAQVRDRETPEKKNRIFQWMQGRRGLGDQRFIGLTDDQLRQNNNPFPPYLPGGPERGLGRSRVVIGESKNPVVKSGITGLDKLEKGRLSLNFSEIGLDKSAAKYLDGSGKEEVAGRIGGLLRNKGMADDLAKAVEEQIKRASYLILHNKEAGISGAERRGTVAHELLHARIGNTFRDEELKGAWNSMNEESRETARQKVKKIYSNENMSEDAIMHEYFTEGLTNKTRWAEKNPDKKITLDAKTENSLEDLLKSKGSNIASFTSNLTSTKPLSTPLYTDTEKEENITNTIVEVSDPQLQGAMKDLVGAIQNMGNGFDSIKNVAGSLRDLSNVTDKNRMTLENSAREYRYNANKLNKLSEKIA